MAVLKGAILCLSFYLSVKSIPYLLYIYHLLSINHYVVYSLLENTYNLIFFRNYNK